MLKIRIIFSSLINFGAVKKIIAVFLLVLISTQLFIRIGVYISWKANQEVLAKTECINRNVKNSCCKAKCQLAKQFSKLDKSSSENEKQNHKNIYSDFEPFIIVEASVKDKPIDYCFEIRSYKIFNDLYDFSLSRYSFHPPNQIV